MHTHSQIEEARLIIGSSWKTASGRLGLAMAYERSAAQVLDAFRRSQGFPQAVAGREATIAFKVPELHTMRAAVRITDKSVWALEEYFNRRVTELVAHVKQNEGILLRGLSLTPLAISVTSSDDPDSREIGFAVTQLYRISES
jgi:hypothetical protein